jgi:hypothetical protein
MRPIGTIAAGLALVSAAAAAHAQTAISRQITSEPVETVVTQGPNGTTVTRRILTPEPGVTSYAPPFYAPPLGLAPPAYPYPPAAPEVVETQYVEPAAPARITRRVTTSRPATATTSRPTTVGVSTRTPERTRTETTRRVVERPVRSATRTVAVPPPSDQALVLTLAQRQAIYRSVAQREYHPAPVPPVPVVAPADVYAPPPVAGYPLRTVYPADEAYRDYAYDPYHDRYYDRDYRDPYQSDYRWDGVPLGVGARIPQSVPLYAVPEPVAFRIPVARPYSYAVIEDRVYLVDPASGVIVAEITP